MYKETRDVLEEEIGKKDECDMDTFGTLDSSERAIVILGDRWWPQATKQEEDKMSKNYIRNIRKNVLSAQNVGRVSVRSRNGAMSRKECVVNGQTTKASNK